MKHAVIIFVLFISSVLLSAVIREVLHKPYSEAAATEHIAEVTWYHTDHALTCAVNPRHPMPDGTLILFTNEDVVPYTAVVVKVHGRMKPGSKADFDLAPGAFNQLAPLEAGRIRVSTTRIYP